MAGTGLQPAWVFNLAALGTELGGSIVVILNRAVWIGAGALGIFTVLATLLAHRFWDLAGAARVMETNSFLEHAAISAAFILVTVVGFGRRSSTDDHRAASVDRRSIRRQRASDGWVC
jgi:transmembrane protein